MFTNNRNKHINLFIIVDNAMYSFFLKYHAHEYYQFNVLDFPTFGSCTMYHGEIRPDIILLDYELPYINGLQTIPQLKKLWPQAVIVAISSRVDKTTAYKLEQMNVLYCGAKKDCAVVELNKVIDHALVRLEAQHSYFR